MSDSPYNANGPAASYSIMGVPITKKIKTLALAFVLFLTIAVAQLIGALIANSLALLSDTSSMFLDAVTYAFNIYAEAQPKEDKLKTQKNLLIASGISFFALLGITLYFLIDAAMLLASKEVDGDDVNAFIVLGFAVAGLLIDFGTLFPYCIYGIDQGDEHDEASRMNMCSALSHILSDTMRSTTTLIESFVIIYGNVNGARADAFASLIVSSLIIVGLVKSISDWMVDVKKFCYGEKLDEEKGQSMKQPIDDSGEERKSSPSVAVSEIGAVEAEA
mmetsp:Transcript_32784/g.45743  ORF Transcript_32784/g.45743 Transcript_32784/m.45743 type:complete len:276 (-) Transcript_32784:521-1348(-)|eukprot:CAMPEP_0185269566 /NCGR_PEP_ID=MMETSP1359-20130426/40203_1 /TAXON_ID=552665 /ORGANISM="Bigelowiella longifila, Strain CCMP242" /LENGTH=275 /DNA_ID=CAMNT_0027860789 /DNA_START=42 /DNA_END=869 /DNA_ORIENTATION=+